MNHSTKAEGNVVEVEFVVSDPQYPLVAISAETGCRAELIHILPRSDNKYVVYYHITDSTPERVLEVIEDFDRIEGRIVSSSPEMSIIEFQISGDGEFFVISLTDAGAIPTELSSYDGTARIAAEIPSINSVTGVTNQVRETYPSLEIVARRQKSYSVPLFHQQQLYEAIIDMLTPRQHEALLLAYMNGFYDWPRDITGEELAAEMDINPATFHQHLRAAEQKLLGLIFGEGDDL